ncbi:MAG: proton-conducting transporter membrane subunit, partial [Bacillota bacterium]|nr:proton-conducting transporter membrane subunit [Bacillota bacterium]
EVTPLGLLFALFASFLWMMAALFSLTYLASSHAQGRYYFYFLLCLAGTLGVFLAGDLFTLFVFFELVSLGSYPLVVHEETPEAMAAGRLYLYMGVAGGLVLLLGTTWLQSLNGGTSLGAALAVAAPVWPWATAMVLLVAGFGVKAGMFPVHIWLPKAHPVAPSPASALLSGVMIKTGAYGIYRVLRLFLPEAAAGGGGHGGAARELALLTGDLPAPAAQINLGLALGRGLVAVALVTIFLGAVLALVQTNAKRVLAYSSVSQMGYILLGAGLAGVLGSGEAMGAAGFALHVFNHALFKSTMFMLIGVVYLKTHQLELDRLGGLARRLPVTAAVFALAVAGIAGVPGLNGYASKTLLHDGILVLAAHGPGWKIVEALFTLAGAMTLAYTAKLWYFVFWRRPRAPAAHPGVSLDHVRETWYDKLLALALAAPMTAVGLRPAAAVGRLLAPALVASGYDSAALHHVEAVRFFAWPAVQGAALSLGLGAALLFVLYRLKFPTPAMDRGPSVEGTFLVPLIRLGGAGCDLVTALDRGEDTVAIAFGHAVARGWIWLADSWAEGWRRLGRALGNTAARAARFLPSLDYAPGDSATSREFNLLNLDFDFVLVLAVIALTLVMLGVLAWPAS